MPNLLQGIGRDPIEGQQLGHPSAGETFPAGDVSAAERRIIGQFSYPRSGPYEGCS
jgi:hypothetical protein